MYRYRPLLKRFVPSFAERVHINSKRHKRPPKGDMGPDEVYGVKPCDRPTFNLLVHDLRTRDWPDPQFKVSKWLEELDGKVSELGGFPLTIAWARSPRATCLDPVQSVD